MKKDFLINLALVGTVALALTIYNQVDGTSSMTPRSLAVGLILWPAFSYVVTLVQRERTKAFHKRQERHRAKRERKP